MCVPCVRACIRTLVFTPRLRIERERVERVCWCACTYAPYSSRTCVFLFFLCRSACGEKKSLTVSSSLFLSVRFFIFPIIAFIVGTLHSTVCTEIFVLVYFINYRDRSVRTRRDFGYSFAFFIPTPFYSRLDGVEFRGCSKLGPLESFTF